MTSVYPDPNRIIANEYGTTCFLKNVIKAPNIEVGDFTYYDDADDPTKFEERNVLFNYPIFGDKLIIGRYCMIAQGVKYELMVRQPGPEISDAIIDPFELYHEAMEKRRAEKTAKEKA